MEDSKSQVRQISSGPQFPQNIIKVIHRNNFTVINNDAINDKNLSLEALAILTYLISKPADWRIMICDLTKRFDCNKDRINKYLNTLEEFGYLIRIKTRSKGRILPTISYICDDPFYLKTICEQTHNIHNPPQPDFPVMVNSGQEDPPLQKKEIKKERCLKKKDKTYVDLKADAPVSNPVLEIFDYWKATMNHPRSVLDDKRRRCIQKALKDYSMADLKFAIDGCKNTPFNMGDNSNGQIHDDITLILRSSAYIERFIGNLVSKPRVGKKNASERESGALNVRLNRMMKMVPKEKAERDITNETLLIR